MTMADDPGSPCNKICQMDSATGLCRGCLRTAAEIAAWPQMDAAAKRRLLARLGERKAALSRDRLQG